MRGSTPRARGRSAGAAAPGRGRRGRRRRGPRGPPRRRTLLGSMLLRTGEVDGMLCGTWGTTAIHLHYIDQVIGLREGAKTYACMNGLILPGRQVMLVDTHINYDPTAEQLAEITIMAADEMKRFGLHTKAARPARSTP